MKTPKDAFGLNLDRTQGPVACKGSHPNIKSPQDKYLSPRQAAWMTENKPLYYTGKLLTDLPHIPQHLRFL